jgi:hypothetical protein
MPHVELIRMTTSPVTAQIAAKPIKGPSRATTDQTAPTGHHHSQLKYVQPTDDGRRDDSQRSQDHVAPRDP